MSVKSKDILIKIIFALVSTLSTFIVTTLRSIDETQRVMSAEISAIKQVLKIHEALPEQVTDTRRSIFKLESEVHAAHKEIEKINIKIGEKTRWKH